MYSYIKLPFITLIEQQFHILNDDLKWKLVFVANVTTRIVECSGKWEFKF